jgi:hypothetical protein
MLCIFWVFLFYGICSEQDRREKQQSSRKWLQERALNEHETQQLMKVAPQREEELLKAMRTMYEYDKR